MATLPKRRAPTRAMRTKPPGLQLRGLSVRDPWITRIGRGVKWIELRKRNTLYRGWVVFCSAVKLGTGRGAERFTAAGFEGPRGFALYIGRIVDSVRATSAHARGASATPLDGEWAWLLEDVQTLPAPAMPVSGKLGLWHLPARLLAHVKRARAHQEIQL